MASKVGENEEAIISGKDKDETVDVVASESSSDESREHEDHSEWRVRPRLIRRMLSL